MNPYRVGYRGMRLPSHCIPRGTNMLVLTCLLVITTRAGLAEFEAAYGAGQQAQSSANFAAA